ncbi:hypothetical protein ERN12_02545 [Rhodobacteraceae bacterium]|nr:hypothetical protein ERN12_02545 [Paracoccaceae bacterium]
MQLILASIEPYFLELLSVVITAMLGVAIAFAKDRFGLEIEARHREALHSALMTGARLALSRMGAHGSNSAMIDAALSYAHMSVPDSIKRLRPSENLLAELAESKLSLAEAEKHMSPQVEAR